MVVSPPWRHSLPEATDSVGCGFGLVFVFFEAGGGGVVVVFGLFISVSHPPSFLSYFLSLISSSLRLTVPSPSRHLT